MQARQRLHALQCPLHLKTNLLLKGFIKANLLLKGFIAQKAAKNNKNNKKKMKNMAKCEKHFLRYYAYLTSQINHFLFHSYFSHILHLDIIKSEINFKLKVKMNKMLIYGFQWG